MRKTHPKRIIFLWISSVSFLEVVVGHRILPDYTDNLLRKARWPLMDWRRQEREDRSTSDSSPPQPPARPDPNPNAGHGWILGKIPLIEPPKGVEKKIFKIK